MHPEHDPPTTPLASPAKSRASASILGTADPFAPPAEPPTTAIPIQQGAAWQVPVQRGPTQQASGPASPAPDAGPSPSAWPPEEPSPAAAVAATRARARSAAPATARRPTPGPAAGDRADRRSRTPAPRARCLLVPLLVGALVAIAVGAYGRLHQPGGYAVGIAGFSTLGYAKAWLASAAALFGVIQLFTGMTLSGRLLANPPGWAAGLHRWSGRIAVLVSVPVAVQCLYALGYQSGSTRVWLHSLLGCLFYGAFTAKMLSLSRPGTPRWAVPLLGGVVFSILIAVWLTSALWLFSRQGVHL